MYGTNLTDLARNDKIDRVIGRDREIDRVLQILNRRTKNNPVLIGEPELQDSHRRRAGRTDCEAPGARKTVQHRDVPAGYDLHRSRHPVQGAV